MVTTGLLVRLDAKPGKEDDVEQFLASALPLVNDEPATMAWFAIRFGRGEYGIFDVFPDEDGRAAHLSGPVATALGQRSDELFASPPEIVTLDVLADKLPSNTTAMVTKGLLLSFAAKSGHEAEVEKFLRDARPIVEDEDKTTAWFAIDFGDGRYGIFDVFPDNGGRFAHLTGRVPRELAKHALSLLGSFPDMDMLNVVAHKLPK